MEHSHSKKEPNRSFKASQHALIFLFLVTLSITSSRAEPNESSPENAARVQELIGKKDCGQSCYLRAAHEVTTEQSIETILYECKRHHILTQNQLEETEGDVASLDNHLKHCMSSLQARRHPDTQAAIQISPETQLILNHLQANLIRTNTALYDLQSTGNTCLDPSGENCKQNKSDPSPIVIKDAETPKTPTDPAQARLQEIQKQLASLEEEKAKLESLQEALSHTPSTNPELSPYAAKLTEVYIGKASEGSLERSIMDRDEYGRVTIDENQRARILNSYQKNIEALQTKLSAELEDEMPGRVVSGDTRAPASTQGPTPQAKGQTSTTSDEGGFARIITWTRNLFSKAKEEQKEKDKKEGRTTAGVDVILKVEDVRGLSSDPLPEAQPKN